MTPFLKLWLKNLKEGASLSLVIAVAWITFLGPIALLMRLTNFTWPTWIYFAVTFVWIVTVGSLGDRSLRKAK